MKKIIFKRLRLLNFCGIRELEVSFGSDITTISGGNGLGKSTVASALTYVLFGTDIKGNTLDIKTYDQHRHIIPEIPHEAELVVTVDGDETILKRTLTDSWKGEQVKNTYKYFVNDEVCTASDYKKAVDNICPEITFRLCSSATDFVSRPWQDQRKFLQTLSPAVTAEEITQGSHDYDFVLEAMKKQDLDAYIKHIKYRKGEVQKQLDEIPVRLSMLNKALPEAEDWEELLNKVNAQSAVIKDIDSQIAAIKSGGAMQVRNDGIRKQLEFQRKRMDEMEKGARNLAADEATKHQSDLITAQTAHSKALAMVSELQAKMDSFTEVEIRIKQQLEDASERNKQGGRDYEAVSSETWQWNDDDSFCPHCGQPLPMNKLSEMKRASETRFNERKAQRIKELMELASRIKNEKAQCQALLEEMEEDRKTTTNQLTEAHKALAEAEKHLAEVKKEEPRSYGLILGENANYKQAADEVARLTAELEMPMETDEEQQQLLVDLHKRLQETTTEMTELETRYARKESFDRITALIDEDRKNKAIYQDQLDELEAKLDTADSYQQLSCNALESAVNTHFSYVQFSLFKTNLDGERKPFCECYHNGVPYSRLNGAAKVNAGIDIANAISQFYDVSVPMVLDECESNLNPIYNGGQQIRLCVAPVDKLTFAYEEWK